MGLGLTRSTQKATQKTPKLACFAKVDRLRGLCAILCAHCVTMVDVEHGAHKGLAKEAKNLYSLACSAVCVNNHS